MIKRILITLAALCWAPLAFAQSAPGLYNGQVPTAAQWNSYFAAKQDYVPGALTVLGPGASTPADSVCWASSYPQVYDCGALPKVTAGTGITVTSSNNNYTVSVNPYVVPRGYIDGLTMSTAGGSATFAVAAGQAADSTAALIETLSASISKTTSSWTQGTGNGCLDTGSIAGSTWYYIWLIEKTDKSAVDVLCSTSNSSPTMPSGWSYKRYIGALYTNSGGATWISFIQVGNEFRWSVPVGDISTTTLGTAATSYTMSVPNVPVLAHLRGWMSNGSANTGVLITSPLTSAPTFNSPNGNETAYATAGSAESTFSIDVLTKNQQVKAVANNASTTLYAVTHGWTDFRGANN